MENDLCKATGKVEVEQNSKPDLSPGQSFDHDGKGSTSGDLCAVNQRTRRVATQAGWVSSRSSWVLPCPVPCNPSFPFPEATRPVLSLSTRGRAGNSLPLL